MTSATKTFSAWLKKARAKSKMTYGELSKKADVSTATIHALEHGQGSPSLDTAEKLCNALGTSLEATVRVRKPKEPVRVGSFPANPYNNAAGNGTYAAASDPEADA